MSYKRPQLQMFPQPTETACGPTCLQSLYAYYGLNLDVKQIMEEVAHLEEGGTLAVLLAQHALKYGFKTKVYTYNLDVFDPSWFYPEPLSRKELIKKLILRSEEKKKKRRMVVACLAYIKYLERGGKIRMRDLNRSLLRSYLRRGLPILTGLSSTYLYSCARETFDGVSHTPQDILGDPQGHFVVLEHYEPDSRTITVLDPFENNPYSHQLRYNIKIDRLINSILLGVMTYDANLLVIEKH